MTKEIIFADSDFTFAIITRDVGNRTITSYEVISGDVASEFCIEIKLSSEFSTNPDAPTKFRQVNIVRGINVTKSRNSISDTLELIEVLKKAVEFAKRVEDYLKDNGLFVG